MNRDILRKGASAAAAVLLLCAAATVGAHAQSGGTLPAWLDAVEAGLERTAQTAAAGDVRRATDIAVRTYLDYYERIESYYGRGGEYGAEPLAGAVTEMENRFHRLLAATEASRIRSLATAMAAEVADLRRTVREADVPLKPAPADVDIRVPEPGSQTRQTAETAEIRAILDELAAAENAYRAGNADLAARRVEHAYLERFEMLEPRLPSEGSARVEQLIHIVLRPQIARGAPAEEVGRTFAALRATLLDLDAALAEDAPFWFGAFNAFVIILREGLEAALLVAALLAYLGATGAEARHRRQIYGGVAAGIAASFATWFVARALIPIGGASRELIEGLTALTAVAVLLYVSLWIFQKSYIHDWKKYLQEHAGKAVTGGSALAMAGLAFAAVYREGFETVLFYQALLFETGPSAVLAGFLPGLIIILGVAVGIVRLGLRLPLKKVFGVTNAILIYLAFVFLGKGLYNLQEAGLFTATPLAWAPDNEAVRLLLGFYPLAETLSAQGIFVATLGGLYLWYRRAVLMPRRRQEVAPEPVPSGK